MARASARVGVWKTRRMGRGGTEEEGNPCAACGLAPRRETRKEEGREPMRRLWPGTEKRNEDRGGEGTHAPPLPGLCSLANTGLTQGALSSQSSPSSSPPS
eukprot:352246-Chlamydomonas_euryale.AAC.2